MFSVELGLGFTDALVLQSGHEWGGGLQKLMSSVAYIDDIIVSRSNVIAMFLKGALLGLYSWAEHIVFPVFCFTDCLVFSDSCAASWLLFP